MGVLCQEGMVRTKAGALPSLCCLATLLQFQQKKSKGAGILGQ